MRFREVSVDIDGTHYRLRELSGLALELGQAQPNPTRAGFALIALSLIDEHGTMRFGADSVEAGIDEVRSWPARVASRLSAAVEALNQDDADAVGN